MQDFGLARTSMISCNGQVTHDLTVLPDGQVRIVTGSVTATLDVRTGLVLPRGYRLPEDVLAAARTMVADLTG